MRALAVFHDHGEHWLDRLLKPGFRHVFCAVESGNYWIMLDPQMGRPVIEVVAPAGYDLATHYRAEGHSVVEQTLTDEAEPLRAPFLASNCVGAVKAVLGLRWPLVLTPWQLYRRLTR